MLRYTLQDAERWAAFSGDHNPIHFDRTQAARLGSDELSVHGMRAMLDLKHFMDTAAQLSDTLCQAEYLSFMARLRRPLWCNRNYALSFLPGKRPQRISAVMTEESGEPCFESRLDTPPTIELEPNGLPHSISHEQWHSLDQAFPGPKGVFSRWLFLDSILFRFLVNAPETFHMISKAIPGLPGQSLLDIFSQVTVIQTHHETRFHSSLLHAHEARPPRDDVYYAIQAPLITGELHDGALLRIGIQAWSDAQPLMTTTLTLKVWPPAGQAHRGE